MRTSLLGTLLLSLIPKRQEERAPDPTTHQDLKQRGDSYVAAEPRSRLLDNSLPPHPIAFAYGCGGNVGGSLDSVGEARTTGGRFLDDAGPGGIDTGEGEGEGEGDVGGVDAGDVGGDIGGTGDVDAGGEDVPVIQDGDGDGVPDSEDNCPVDRNPNQQNSDQDPSGDACDNCPELTQLSEEERADLDNDGEGDLCDDDRDGDRHKNVDDNCPDIPNRDQANNDRDEEEATGNPPLGDDCDPDDDNDGINDERPDNCPMIKNFDQADIDRDGIGDLCDSDRDGDGFDNGRDKCPDLADNQADLDRDGIGDACDFDRDGDGVNNEIDLCPDVRDNQVDLDGDGLGDECDPDDDGDGFNDDVDTCPRIRNEDQNPEVCARDLDGDGVENTTQNYTPDIIDNCPTVPNPEQADTNGDGRGDACTPECTALRSLLVFLEDDDPDIRALEWLVTGAERLSAEGYDPIAVANLFPENELARVFLREEEESGQVRATVSGYGSGEIACTPEEGIAFETNHYPEVDPLLPAENEVVFPDEGGPDPCIVPLDFDDGNTLTFSWRASDPDGDGIEQIFKVYKVVGDRNIEVTYRGLSIDAGDEEAYSITFPTGYFEAGARYFWQVEVTDTHEENTATLTTPPRFFTTGLDAVQCGDADNDGHVNVRDNCPNARNADQEDLVHINGIGDACDDPDGDGEPDSSDNCPDVANPRQEDRNVNGVGDACEDSDGDGVYDASDNCPNVPNADQADVITPGNGRGDACDDTSDGDGIADATDTCPTVANAENNPAVCTPTCTPQQAEIIRQPDQAGEEVEIRWNLTNTERFTYEDAGRGINVVQNFDNPLAPQVGSIRVNPLATTTYDQGRALWLDGRIIEAACAATTVRVRHLAEFGPRENFTPQNVGVPSHLENEFSFPVVNPDGNPLACEVEVQTPDHIPLEGARIAANLVDAEAGLWRATLDAGILPERTDLVWVPFCLDDSDREINGEEVPFTTSAPNLVAWYRFNDPENLGFDSSGNDMHGVIQGDPAWVQGENINGGALLLNGDDSVIVPNHPTINPPNQLGVEARFRMAQDGREYGLLQGGGNGTTNGWRLKTSGALGHVSCYINPAGHPNNELDSEALSSENFNHVVCSYSGEFARIYVSGVERGGLPTEGLLNNSSGDFKIGTCDGLPSFEGHIDEVALYEEHLENRAQPNCARIDPTGRRCNQ